MKENDFNKGDFEDIFSSSATPDTEEIFSSSSAQRKHYYRSSSKQNKKKSKNKRLKAVLITLTSVLLVFTVVLGLFLYILKDYNYVNLEATNSNLGFDEQINQKVINIALFGVDTRDTKSLTGNTDSIMILSLNTQTKKIKIISIMRDSLVGIERNGSKSYRKINSAYALGGPELAIKTINQSFNLDISEYATVNFFGMAEIIDAVGGIDVPLTEKEVVPYSPGVFALNNCIYDICDKLKIDPKPYYVTESGTQHLNGIQATAYARIRYTANFWGTRDDYGRTERQRYVMEQLFNSVKNLPKTKYLSLIKTLLPFTETSLSVGDAFKIACNIMLHSPTFEQSRIPLDEYQMTSTHKIPAAGSYVYFDLDYAADVLHGYIYDDIQPQTYMEQNPVRKNDWYGQLQ